MVLAVCHAGIHASKAMVSPRSLRGRLAGAFRDHTRAASVAAPAHDRGYMHALRRYQATDGSGNHVSGNCMRMSGDARAGRARRNVTNSPDGNRMTAVELDTGPRVAVPGKVASANQSPQNTQISGEARFGPCFVRCICSATFFYSPGRGMPRSLQMRLATGSTISAWRGTALVLRLPGFQKMECRPPSRRS